MARRLLVIIWIGLFIAQMWHVGLHQLEAVTPTHDCAHHGSGDWGEAGEVEHDEPCLICELGAGQTWHHNAQSVSLCLLPQLCGRLTNQVQGVERHDWGTVSLRGPPVWV